ncbi:class I tRNA ligase family protein, partial [Candidatus Pacearchaeota archaeon]|nr:class I tRNA ligase family protein [Candidatus Pacearchaeota archaeon]
GLEWDWSISRERHFGIPIPVWECKECGEIILANEKELPVDPLQTKKKCPKCKKDAIPEEKVLDTWATSSLTPQIADSLVKNKIGLPFSLRPQAHDIIRTWAFYTIVKGFLHENKTPWKDIVISGNVSLKGEKMSKSKGNVINPKEVVEKYGADALRYWAAGSKLGNDLDYQEKDLVTGKKFVTKLINASKFVFMNLEDYNGKKIKIVRDDEEFLGKLNELIQSCTKNFEKYEYSKVKADVEQFFWSDFCDYYLETVKHSIYNNKKDKSSAQYTLYKSLLTILKLIAPIMPFITEEIYQNHFKKIEKDKSIHISQWPKIGKEKSKGDWDIIKKNISKIRQEKSKAQVSLNTPITKPLILPKRDCSIIKNYEERFLSISGACLIKPGKEFKIDLTPAEIQPKKD